MRQTLARLILAGSAALLLLSACGGGGDAGGGNPQPTNTAPVANAGPAQIVNAGVTVTLNGTASSDTDGSIASYTWTQTAGVAVTLNNSASAQPSFLALDAGAVDTVTFRLVVTDNRGTSSAASTVSITVNPFPNAVPVANAGAPQTVTANTTVTLNGTASADPDGTIATYTWVQTAGTAVTLNNANTAQPNFVAPSGLPAATLTFSLLVTDNRGGASAPASVTITVNTTAANVTISGVVRYARPQFLGSPTFGLDYGNVVNRPVRGVIVRALDANTQAVLGTGTTTDNGNYTFTVAANTSISIQVIARLQRDTPQPLPRWDVRVQNGVPGTVPYTYTSSAFNSSLGTQDVSIPLGISGSGVATGVRDSAPFAVLDTIYSAIQTVLGVASSANFPTLIVDWGSQSEGTFFSTAGGQHIALMSDLTEDTDEFDQHVVAHEFGHYIERNFSRSDSIGGPHGVGDQLDPRVAFGEGFAYAFSAIVLGDTIVRDTFVDPVSGQSRGGGFNVEVNPPALQGAGPGCWCSETSVWSIIWDLYDNPSDGSDAVALGFAPIWQVLTTAQLNTEAVTSIFSFIASLNVTRPAESVLINALVSAQNISAGNASGDSINSFATTETHNPLAAPNDALPVFTNISLGTPVVIRTTGTADRHYNNLGNRRYLRFISPTTRVVTVTLTTSNPAPSPDPDFLVFRSGTLVSLGDDPPTEYPETETFTAMGGASYIIDAYDCANGCSTVQGTPGDYDLTVTIN